MKGTVPCNWLCFRLFAVLGISVGFMKKKLVAVISALIIISFSLNIIKVGNSVKQSSAAVSDELTVILDAGHGGEDGGAIGKSGSFEKDINLQFTLKVNDYLSLLGISTYMVRTEDRSVGDNSLPTIRERKVSDIRARAALMELFDNSIYLSIHQNEFSQSYVHGTQMFYAPNSEESKTLANIIQKTVCSLTQPENTKVPKESGTNIYVLYNATKPACLCECGFVSNPEEEKLLLSEDYQRKFSLALSYGVLNYLISEENNGTEV